MALQRVSASRIPRHWTIIGEPDAGKSTFLSAMSSKILLIDADRRAAELAQRSEVFTLGDEPELNCDPYAIAQHVRKERKSIYEAGVTLFAVDSLTAMIEGSISLSMEGNKRGLNKNRVASFSDKSNMVKLLQDAITQTGGDSAWIWHIQKRLDSNAKEIMRQTLPETERKTIQRSLNAMLYLYKKSDGRRALRVRWSRAQGDTLKNHEIVDSQGFWIGVPEQVDRLLAGTLPYTQARERELAESKVM